jgi:NhaP-type Na+/H+ or K+/H+ antiporter
MVPVGLALLGSGLRPPSVAFIGWFGPRGLASILFALLIVEEQRLDAGDFLGAVVVLTVLGSTLLHGLSAYPLAKRYGAYASTHRAAEAERTPVNEMPVRIRHVPEPDPRR